MPDSEQSKSGLDPRPQLVPGAIEGMRSAFLNLCNRCNLWILFLLMRPAGIPPRVASTTAGAAHKNRNPQISPITQIKNSVDMRSWLLCFARLTGAEPLVLIAFATPPTRP